MTRECATDFKKLNAYIEAYKISENLKKQEYMQSLKILHKCYFSIITWHAEMMTAPDSLNKIYSNCNEDIIYRLAETASDLGSALFNWINGNYKASRVMIRVAIENFIRAISALENKAQLTEKNVYSLFEIATAQKSISECQTTKSCYDSLHSDYKLLCQDAHTATRQNMAQLTSLADFPMFENDKSQETAEVFIRTSRNVTSLFCILFNTFYQKMHHRNRENILNGLTKETKPIICAPPDEA